MNKRPILIVDDDVEFRESLKDFIQEKLGAAFVVEAEHGQLCLSKLNWQSFHLLLLDLNMPRMDGYSVLSHLFETTKPEQLPKNIAVISADDVRRLDADYFQFIEFFKKPMNFEKFEEYLSLVFKNVASKNPKNGRVDVTLIDLFVSGALTALESTCGLQATRKGISIKKESDSNRDISALIFLDAGSFQGSMAISFEKSVFLKAVNEMLDTDYIEINEENQDAAAEFCNQAFGIAKARLSEMGLNLKPAIPKVIMGAGHSLKHEVKGVCLKVDFEAPSGMFTIESIVKAA